MKHVTASEARRNWFRILDEVAAGAVVSIDRGGRRIVIKREDPTVVAEETPDYRRIIRAPSIEDAERWSWDWPGPEEPLQERTRD